MKNYKAIIFDLGNVVFHCSFEPTFNYWSDISSQDKEVLKRKFDVSEFHERFEKSLISPFQFRKNISQLLNYNLTVGEFEHGWNAIYGDIIDGLDNLLIGLKKQYRIIALTNTNETHSKFWKVKYKSTLALFEKVFSSHEMKFRKPEFGAYYICLDYLALTPNKVLFLDDKAENIEGARRVGIDSVLITSFNQMVNDLTKKGINITDNKHYKSKSDICQQDQ